MADHDQATETTTSPNIMTESLNTENKNTISRNITIRNRKRAKKDVTDVEVL